MNVELIDFTGKGRPDEAWHAAHIMIFTKGTRLNMESSRLAEIARMSPEEKLDQLEYMSKTIPSSWEFVNFTFLLSSVTRATAQQITRTRTASFAMQSQRVADLSAADVTNPFALDDDGRDIIFDDAARSATAAYRMLLRDDAPKEDARGILPMNTQCNIVAQYNLRTLSETLSKRRSLRAQGEYREIAHAMQDRIEEALPWAHVFFQDKHAAAIELLEKVASEVGIETGSGPGWDIAKAIDLIRGS